MPSHINPGIKRLAVPLDQLSAHPDDPFRGDLHAVCRLLKEEGQYRPVVAQASTGRVLKGSEQLAAARSLGWTQLAAHLIDVDDAEAKRILAAEVATSELGTYDEAALVRLLTPLDAGDLLTAGYSEQTLALLDPQPREKADPATQSPEQPAPGVPATPLRPEEPWGNEGLGPAAAAAPPIAVQEAMLLYPADQLPAVLADLEALARKWDEPDYGALVTRALERAALP